MQTSGVSRRENVAVHLLFDIRIETLLARHCEERPPKPAFGRRRMRRSNPSTNRYRCEMDCFAEPVIGRAFARPVGSQ